jgi:hypothetical protein
MTPPPNSGVGGGGNGYTGGTGRVRIWEYS